MRRQRLGDVMTRAVVSAYQNATFKEIVRVMVEHGITALPVIDERHRVIGVVSESDLLAKEKAGDRMRRRRLLRRGGSRAKATAATAGELMTSPAITIGPEATVVQAARLLERHRIKRLPVVDDEDRLVGIVSRRDLLRVFTHDQTESAHPSPEI